MNWELVNLGNFSGGMNESFPPSRIRENECALLQNMEYINGDVFPQTRRGTQFIARLDGDFPNYYTGMKLAGQTDSHLFAIHVTATDTEFFGKSPSGSFAAAGTTGLQTAEWSSVEWDQLLIISSPTATSVAYKWTGTGNVAALGGTPPNPMYDLAVWNNRIFAVDDDRQTIHYCALGDGEDWTDTDPVAGAGFFTMIEGNDNIIKIIGHRERLIIFRERSIWQVITSLPNTDPDGWRLELLTSAGGCSSKYTVKPLMNDLIFYNHQTGVNMLRAVEQFGDFELTNLSDNVDMFDYPAINLVTAGIVENKYLVALNTETHAYCLEMTREGPRWSKFVFNQNFGGAEKTEHIPFIGDGAIVDGAPRILIAFHHYNDSLTDEYDLCYWPNLGNGATASSLDIGDDQWVDHYDGPDGTSRIKTRLITRAFDGGSLATLKKAYDIGFALRRLSTTTINAAQSTGSAAPFTMLVYFNEESSHSIFYNFSDADMPTVLDHAQRVLVAGSRGNRFRSIQIELFCQDSGVGILYKGLDMKAAKHNDRGVDTMEMLAGYSI